MALSALLWWHKRTGAIQLMSQGASFVLLGTFLATDRPSGVGVMELIYIYFMLNAWVLDTGETVLRALLLNV